MVQERLGHSALAMTMDTYGHLFPRDDSPEELREAELALIAATFCDINAAVGVGHSFDSLEEVQHDE